MKYHVMLAGNPSITLVAEGNLIVDNEMVTIENDHGETVFVASVAALLCAKAVTE